ncbi:MAG: hypothetical protein H6772_00635 [Pseudomonadales bacterium]|nr:hypothetical protein [Pseudomonadales bacterium]
MSAQTQTPSEELIKLKRYLEKTKTDFSKGNTDLLEWLHDRNLKIENLGKITDSDQTNIESAANSVDSQVIEKFAKEPTEKVKLETEISLEEYDAIFEKLVNLLVLPAGQLERESELYLEQQLTDLLGFDVAAKLDDQQLNHSTGLLGPEPHLKRYPNDELKNHDDVLEAGIANARSAFGWFVNHGQITPEATQFEKYYFSLQLYHLETWSSHYKELKEWYKFRKMIAINPMEKIAVVGVVGNIDHESQLKKQFGASPEIIREGMIWSPKSRGKILLMFVDDPENKVPLGPIDFKQLFKQN